MKQISFLFTFIILLYSVSCSEQSSEDDEIVHPIEEKMPYSDEPAEMLQVINAGDYLDDLPGNVQSLFRILRNDLAEEDAAELNILSSDQLDLSFVNDSTLLILDKDQDRLIQYNLNSHNYDAIATQ